MGSTSCKGSGTRAWSGKEKDWTATDGEIGGGSIRKMWNSGLAIDIIV